MRIYEWPIMPMSSLIDFCVSFEKPTVFTGGPQQRRPIERKVVLRWLFWLLLALVGLTLLGVIIAAVLHLADEIWIHFLRIRWENLPPRIRHGISSYWLPALVVVFGLLAAIQLLNNWIAKRSAVRMLKNRSTEIRAEDLLRALSRVKKDGAADAVIRLACNADLANSNDLSRVLFGLTRIGLSELYDELQMGLEVERWLDIRKPEQIRIIRDAAERAHDAIAQAVERAELSGRENQM